MPTIQQLIDVLKLAPRYLAAIGIFCGLILFTPRHIAETLGVSDLAQNYRQWLGLAFVASITLLIVNGCVYVADRKRHRSRAQESEQRLVKKLNTLTEDEKQILRFYFATESKTNTLRVDDGVVNGLVAHKIIYRSANLGNVIEGFAHNISEFAWEYLHENPTLLLGTTNTYRTDKGQRRLFG